MANLRFEINSPGISVCHSVLLLFCVIRWVVLCLNTCVDDGVACFGHGLNQPSILLHDPPNQVVLGDARRDWGATFMATYRAGLYFGDTGLATCMATWRKYIWVVQLTETN
uniref:Uncharacterized protein n=1 Tax=Spongospora subterranea TaxID=70186 RepID=A0A0H5QKP4_9EUKA|eukprot:CRZ02710.1 hypothetical protein [Spongospora subterranea]